MRLMPVRKRFVRSFPTKDGQEVEIRFVGRFQPKIHWVREIWLAWGKDYARNFLEVEGAIDMEEVCKKYTLRELTDIFSIKHTEYYKYERKGADTAVNPPSGQPARGKRAEIPFREELSLKKRQDAELGFSNM